MRIRKTLVIFLLTGLVVWGGMAIKIIYSNHNMPSRIKRQAEAERKVLTAKFRDKERRLENDYRQKKYLADC